MSVDLDDWISSPFAGCDCPACSEHQRVCALLLEGAELTIEMMHIRRLGNTDSENSLLVERMRQDRIKAALMPKRQSNDP